ncbi:MAG: ATP-binding protein [Planctomycetota bacterium]|nr:ATP-binding protein [Planctomycetota bacterium]
MSTNGEVIERRELELAMEVFAGLSENLSTSFSALAERAERVERELCQANEELASKVAELDALKRHLESILQALPTGVVVRDGEGRMTRANAAATELLGHELEALLGARTLPGLAEAPGTAANEYTRPDGTTRTLARRRSCLPTPDGGAAGSVEIIDDRTELTRLNERLHSLDKMAALGSMAGGIAHEIRNPMNAIQGFAELLAARLTAAQQPDTDAARQESRWCSLIVEGAREVESIVQSLLTLADPKRLHLDRVETDELLREATKAALADVSEAHRTSWDISYASTLEHLFVDRIQVRQALRNLIANSLQAQPEGGAVNISVGVDRGLANITVSDTGPGIPAGLVDRVGDPFFTTRAAGTGLGLALVNSIAQLHGGHLQVHTTAPGERGASFTIQLPLPDQTPTN